VKTENPVDSEGDREELGRIVGEPDKTIICPKCESKHKWHDVAGKECPKCGFWFEVNVP
jgi:hypothetical protein